MNKSITAAVLLATLIIARPVWAHSDESLLDAMSSPHGGQIRAAGPYHLELVAKDGELLLYVTDHADNEINTIGGEGKANIQRVKTRSRITVKLEPSQNNMLTGSGDFQLDPKTVIVVFVKLPEQDAYAARFTPLKPKSAGAGKKAGVDHHHDDQH
ncbi:MAG: hypothetical protein ABI980_14395 [Nitrospirota bacterium]